MVATLVLSLVTDLLKPVTIYGTFIKRMMTGDGIYIFLYPFIKPFKMAVRIRTW